MPASLRFVRLRWFQVFCGGLALFIGAEETLRITGNLNLVATVMLLGAFLVPVTYVTYFTSKESALDKGAHVLPLAVVANCFLVGGATGIIAAGLVEYGTLREANVLGLIGVGAIEETAKLIIPVALYVASRYRSEADGLLLGVAAGMGFAALETMGYGVTALIRSHGNVSTLEQVLLVRGLVSPVGHAAWTGLVCSALWRTRLKTGKSFNPIVLVFFALAVSLHTLWDVAGLSDVAAVTYVGYALVGVASLALLIQRVRKVGVPRLLNPASP